MATSRYRIEAVAEEVLAALKSHPNVVVKSPDGVISAVRHTISENLREEEEIEREAMELLRRHGAAILQQGADFQRLLRDGKKALAKKRGFVI